MCESNKKIELSAVDLVGCAVFVGIFGVFLFAVLTVLVAMSLGGPDAQPNAALRVIAWPLSWPIPYDVFGDQKVGGNPVIGIWAILLNGVIWSVGSFFAVLVLVVKAGGRGVSGDDHGV